MDGAKAAACCNENRTVIGAKNFIFNEKSTISMEWIYDAMIRRSGQFTRVMKRYNSTHYTPDSRIRRSPNKILSTEHIRKFKKQVSTHFNTKLRNKT